MLYHCHHRPSGDIYWLLCYQGITWMHFCDATGIAISLRLPWDPRESFLFGLHLKSQNTRAHMLVFCCRKNKLASLVSMCILYCKLGNPLSGSCQASWITAFYKIILFAVSEQQIATVSMSICVGEHRWMFVYELYPWWALSAFKGKWKHVQLDQIDCKSNLPWPH